MPANAMISEALPRMGLAYETEVPDKNGGDNRVHPRYWIKRPGCLRAFCLFNGGTIACARGCVSVPTLISNALAKPQTDWPLRFR